MAKDSRLKQNYRKNASKLHKNVGDLLRGSLVFQNYRIYQEYPVNRISPYFDSGREKFDWVVLDIRLIIECHGEQHYRPVRFGGITQEEAVVKLQRQIQRDTAKAEAAKKAGWIYVVFKYNEDITLTNLMSKIEKAEQNRVITDAQEVNAQIKAKNKPDRNSTYHQQQLENAKEYRKKRYQEAKKRKQEMKRKDT